MFPSTASVVSPRGKYDFSEEDVVGIQILRKRIQFSRANASSDMN